MEEMSRPQFTHKRERLITSARRSFSRDLEKFVRGLAHGGDHDDGTPRFKLLYDRRNPVNGFLRFDGSSAEFHDDHPRFLIENAFRRHQFGIQDCCPGGASNRVVSTRNEFDVKNWTSAYTSNRYTHAVVPHCVAPWLRTILLRQINHWLRRSTREF